MPQARKYGLRIAGGRRMRIAISVIAILLSSAAAEARHFHMPIIITVPGGGGSSNYTKHTTPGKTVRLSFYRHLNPDCSPIDGLVVRVNKEPENGHAKVSNVREFPHFRKNDLLYACSKRRVSGKIVSYTPKRGFTGQDWVNVEVITGTGNRGVERFAINVH